MTAEAYAAAAGLVERSAAAYVSGVPEEPADAGFFGPGSVTWRVSTDLGRPVAGLRALMLQALHPLAMAGVDQHSNWREDPVGRLAATSGYLATITFGDRAAAERAAARVRRIHEHITGTDTITGQRYEASDPALLLWVHATLVESGVVAAGMFGTPLSAPDADRYVAEMVAAAELVGVPAGQVPGSLSDLESYLTASRSGLRCTPAAAESMAYLLDPPGLDEDIAEIWADIREGVVAALPSWAQDMYDYPAAPRPRPGRPRSGRRSASSTRCSSASPGCSRRGSGSPCGCGAARRRDTARMKRARAAYPRAAQEEGVRRGHDPPPPQPPILIWRAGGRASSGCGAGPPRCGGPPGAGALRQQRAPMFAAAGENRERLRTDLAPPPRTSRSPWAP